MFVWIPLGESYTSKLTGAVLRVVKCEHCDIEYGYVYRLSVEGEGSSFLYLDAKGAARRAEAAAQQKLADELSSGSALVPCPRCRWVQNNMVDHARLQYAPKLKVLGIVAVAIAAVLFACGLAQQSTGFFQAAVAVGLVAAALPFVRFLVAKKYDPNAETELAKRRQPSPHAIWGANLCPADPGGHCPSCKSVHAATASHCSHCEAPLIKGLSREALEGPPAAAKYHRLAFLGLAVSFLGFFGNLVARQNEANEAEAQRHQAHLAPFQARINDYLPAAPEAADMPAPMRGKLITVNVAIRQIDHAYFQLPPQLRAERPEDVGTVVWLQWSEQVVGEYGFNTNAYAVVLHCQVTVLDQAFGKVHEKSFVGGNPPLKAEPWELRSGNGKMYGPPPTPAIVAWLASLPRE